MVLHFGLIFLSFYYRLLKRIFGISNWTLHAKRTFFSKRWKFMTTLGLISWSIGKNSDFKTANLHFLSKVLWIIINFEKKMLLKIVNASTDVFLSVLKVCIIFSLEQEALLFVQVFSTLMLFLEWSLSTVKVVLHGTIRTYDF